MISKIRQNQKRRIVNIVVFLSVACVFASDERPASESALPAVREATFFNSAPVYRKNVPPASFPKRSPPDRLMENAGGLYYIVDASFFVKADRDRSGEYRAPGKSVLVDEALLTGKTTTER